MDDLIIYDKIKASMTEVHDAMVDRDVRIERTSEVGLVYDTYLYSLDQDSKLMMEKALYISEQVKPIERHQDIRQLFGAWVDTMCEIRHSQYVDDGVLCDSLAGLLCRFGPQLEQAKRESGYYVKMDLNKFVLACRSMVDRLGGLAPRLPEPTPAPKGKGAGKGTGKGKGSNDRRRQ